MPLSNPFAVPSYPKVGSRRTTNQTLTLNGITQIIYNTEDEDSHNIHNSSNGNLAITSDTEGTYFLSASLTANFSHANTAGAATLALVVFKNDSSYSEIGRGTEVSVSNFPIGASGGLLLPNLVNGDVISVRASTSFISGGTISVLGSSKNHLSFFKLS